MSEDHSKYHDDNQPHEENHENVIIDENASNRDINRPLINILDSTAKKINKGHQINSEEENKTYLLEFSTVGGNLKIFLSEQDIFPARSYDVFLALQELQSKCELLSIYSSIKELSDDLNKSDSNINFSIKRKTGNIIAITIVFPCEDSNIDNDIEIDLNENIIDDREMFRQLFEKYKSIQHEQEEDIAQFMNRIKSIEEILVPPVVEQPQEGHEGQEHGEILGEEHQNENEQHSEVIKKDEIEHQEEIKTEVIDIKSSQKESKNNTQKGKNVKKGKIEKKVEHKEKFNKKKKK